LKWQEVKEEDVNSYWMNLRKQEDTEQGSTISDFVEHSLWKRLWTSRKTDYGMNRWMDAWMDGWINK
jgi:hypothetical protein